jgi:cytochrome c oxidase subunit 2
MRNGTKLTAVAVWGLGLAAAALALSRRWMPELASEHGAGIDSLLHFHLVSTGIMLLAGHAMLGYCLWRFGRARPVTGPPPSPRAERRSWIATAVWMTVIAEGGVVALGLPVWDRYFGTTAPADALTIEVTTEQFAWNVRYAGPDGVFGRTDPARMSLDNPLGLDAADPRGKDDIVSLNVIHAVAGRAVKIRLRSKDVLHGFFLPNFRVKQDAVPGMTMEFWFVPTRAGRFELACSQLCGFGHYEMKGVLIVQAAEEFARWLEEQRNG